MPHSVFRRLAIGSIAAAALAAACGGSTTAPSTAKLSLTSVSPARGSTGGGTQVTLTGTNFTSATTVTIGGLNAGSITLVNSTTLTATAPPHGAGTAAVTVSQNGETASLPNTYTYMEPSGSAPSIASIQVQGSGPREPTQFASLSESVTVSAVVTDADTAASQLAFSWSVGAGTLSGSGASVTWTAPAQFTTPATITISLTVTDNTLNVAQGSTTLRLHDSVKEIGDLAVDFLVGFSKQLDAAFVVRNFTSSCAGAANELSDVQKDNDQFVMNAYTIGAPSVTVPFTGSCPFRGVFGDACAQVPSTWTSTRKSDGMRGTVTGIDQVTAVLENDQWRLCASDYDLQSSTTSAFRMRLWR